MLLDGSGLVVLAAKMTAHTLTKSELWRVTDFACEAAI